MTKTFSATTGSIAVALFVAALFAYVPVFRAHADVRVPARDRGTTGRAPEPTSTPPASSPVPAPKPPAPNSGSISNSTSGTADSGGNSGGAVITGDESVAVFVVNIGPTNNPPPPQDDEEVVNQPAPAPECDRRSSTDCPITDPVRTR